MRSKSLALLVAVGSVVAMVGPGARSVAALTCAEHPDGTPQAIAAGTERLSSEDRFLDHFDFAVIGTVTQIRTVEQAGDPEYGATTVSVDVEGVLGENSAPAQIDISSPDPGWMSGYPYRRGMTYFIPVQAEGPKGQPNYSFLCDPITEVEPGATEELGRLAADAGIVFSTPEAAPPTPATESADSEVAAADSGSSLGMMALTTIAALTVAAAVILIVALRSRTRSARTAA